jgi:hypothetical protein
MARSADDRRRIDGRTSAGAMVEPDLEEVDA